MALETFLLCVILMLSGAILFVTIGLITGYLSK